MDNQNNIQDELRGMNSGLPVNNSQKNFSVPEGYFDGLAASILAKVKGQNSSVADELQALSPLLAGVSKQMPYSAPNGYFEENTAALPSLFKEEESPVLAAIGKNLPYTIPDGFFETLSENVVSKVARPKAKVVPLFARTWMRAAVAAIVAGIVFIGGYRYLNNSREVQTAYQKPDNAAQPLATKNEIAVVQDIKKVSTQELDEFIKAVPLNPDKLQKSPLPITEKGEAKDMLKDVSEKEMDAFLEQIPTGDQDLAVID